SHALNTTYIQYRVLRTLPPNGDRSGKAGFLNAAERTLMLKLLPFVAYREPDRPQYGNHEWHFQVERHQQESNQDVDEQDGCLVLPQGVAGAGCSLRAWDGA